MATRPRKNVLHAMFPPIQFYQVDRDKKIPRIWGLFTMTLIFKVTFSMRAKNDYFEAGASYEHAITTKLEGILVNLTTYLASKRFCATSKNAFSWQF